MTEHPPVKKVAVLAHSGKGNLGDEATLATVIQNVRLRHPGAAIWAFTLNPANTRERHQVPAFPIRRLGKSRPAAAHSPGTPGPGQTAPTGLAGHLKRFVKNIPLLGSALRGLWHAALAVPAGIAGLIFLVQSSRRLKGTDLFIVAGGGQLGDYFGGAWGFPFTIWKWTLLARMRGARVAFLSVGAGPIRTTLGGRFLRWALSRADYRSFRDEGSRKLIEGLGVAGENHVFPDLVHGWRAAADAGEARPGACVVGINPLPFYDARYWAEDSPDVYQRYVQTLATFAVRLIEAGHKVLLFPTQVSADPPVIEDVAALVRAGIRDAGPDCLTCPPVSSFDDLFAAIARTDLVVASRFHGIILSFLMGRPVIGLSYNQKTDELMSGMGQGEFVTDIDRFDVPWLLSRFERLRTEASAVRCQIESRREAYRSALDSQYDLLLGGAARPEARLALQTA